MKKGIDDLRHVIKAIGYSLFGIVLSGIFMVLTWLPVFDSVVINSPFHEEIQMHGLRICV
jgi:hypothetical protein